MSVGWPLHMYRPLPLWLPLKNVCHPSTSLTFRLECALPFLLRAPRGYFLGCIRCTLKIGWLFGCTECALLQACHGHDRSGNGTAPLRVLVLVAVLPNAIREHGVGRVRSISTKILVHSISCDGRDDGFGVGCKDNDVPHGCVQ